MNTDQCIKNFCQNLRHLRKVYGMNQKEMAKILGISVNKLSKMENCDPSVRIYAALLCRACSYFHKTPDEMLYENWPEMLSARR